MKDNHATGKFPGRSPIRKRRPDALLWPDDLLGNCARLTIIGSSRLLVENHTGLLELTETLIRLDTGYGPIVISGEGLTLCDARPRCMIVRGRIQSVLLPCGGGDRTP